MSRPEPPSRPSPFYVYDEGGYLIRTVVTRRYCTTASSCDAIAIGILSRTHLLPFFSFVFLCVGMDKRRVVTSRLPHLEDVERNRKGIKRNVECFFSFTELFFSGIVLLRLNIFEVNCILLDCRGQSMNL